MRWETKTGRIRLFFLPFTLTSLISGPVGGLVGGEGGGVRALIVGAFIIGFWGCGAYDSDIGGGVKLKSRRYGSFAESGTIP